MRNNKRITVEKYQRIYVDLHFERAGLFELIREEYHPEQVLYPGCSVHITPAFFFPHVVFVDQDPATVAFFAHQEIVIDLIKRHRKYRRKPYIQFIPQDYTRPLPIANNQFDLVLALYAGGVSKACKPYLKTGGLLLTNNHQNDAVEATQEHDLALIAIAQKRQGKYRLVDRAPGEPMKIKSQASQSKRYLRQMNRGVEYIDDERYYIFRRIRPRR